MKTAKITPKNMNSHTLSCEVISEGIPADGDFLVSGSYTFRRGITENFEAGFGIDVIIPQVSIGCKYGFSKGIALDANVKAFFNPFYNEGGWMFIPNFDIALIFGAEKWYGGIKFIAVAGENTEGEIFPFFGVTIPIFNKFFLIPEIGIGLVSVNYYKKNLNFLYTNFGPFIGVGFSF
jgi:hypothetical protein